jgi:ParB family chromosome partitioning protein
MLCQIRKDETAVSLFVRANNDLTVAEQYQLSVLEETIERGLKTFVDVGTALMVVRDSKLYRHGHSTFEDYCRVRWNMGKSRVYQMIDAAIVVENLQESTMVELPTSERQARPLAQLEPEQQREAWRKVVDTAPGGRVTAAHVQSVVDEYEEHAEELAADEDAYTWTGDDPPKPHVTHNSGNNEWHTPSVYVEAARRVLGAIDLDPASNDAANETVQAETYYTAEDDGLLQDWAGTVFMNPPYSDKLVGKFVDKLVYHFVAGDVQSAVVLVNNATETAWFQTLAGHARAICFPSRRIRFAGPNEKSQTGLQGQAFVYIGNDPHAFVEEFGGFGFLVEPL